MAAPLPNPLRVLAVSASDQAHAPVRALLRSARIDLVTMPEQALKLALTHAHDIVLVDREIEQPGLDGLLLAEELVRQTPQTPVIVLAHTADKHADEEAAEAGIADFLLVPGLSTDRLEHAIRYALTHQRALQRLAESEERHALALQGRQRRDLGLGRRAGPDLLLDALEDDARLPRDRDRRDARGVARPRPRR